MTSWPAMPWCLTRAFSFLSRWPTRCCGSPSASCTDHCGPAGSWLRPPMPSSKSTRTSHPSRSASDSPSRTRPSRTPASRVGRVWRRRSRCPTIAMSAALRGRADSIVTANLQHYPTDTLDPLGIQVIHPDSFLLDQLDLAPRIVLDVLREQAANTHHPPPHAHHPPPHAHHPPPHAHRPRRPPRQSWRARVRRRSWTPDLMRVIAICDLGVTSLQTR